MAQRELSTLNRTGGAGAVAIAPNRPTVSQNEQVPAPTTISDGPSLVRCNYDRAWPAEQGFVFCRLYVLVVGCDSSVAPPPREPGTDLLRVPGTAPAQITEVERLRGNTRAVLRADSGQLVALPSLLDSHVNHEDRAVLTTRLVWIEIVQDEPDGRHEALNGILEPSDLRLGSVKKQCEGFGVMA